MLELDHFLLHDFAIIRGHHVESSPKVFDHGLLALVDVYQLSDLFPLSVPCIKDFIVLVGEQFNLIQCFHVPSMEHLKLLADPLVLLPLSLQLLLKLFLHPLEGMSLLAFARVVLLRDLFQSLMHVDHRLLVLLQDIGSLDGLLLPALLMLGLHVSDLVSQALVLILQTLQGGLLLDELGDWDEGLGALLPGFRACVIGGLVS